MGDQKCPVCNLVSEVHTSVDQDEILFLVDCSRCGKYSIDQSTVWSFQRLTLSTRSRSNISGYIAENPGLRIKQDDLPFLVDLRPPSIATRAKRLLQNLAKLEPTMGREITVSRWREIREVMTGKDQGAIPEFLKVPIGLLSATWSLDYKELCYLLVEYLDRDERMVDSQNGASPSLLKITPKGWRFLESNNTAPSQIGFVAMWFGDEMSNVWRDALYPGIGDAGYEPQRVDGHEHNNKIDDEIIASIRGAKFVVADFTAHRGGVYYEAGFAQGLGKPVIWTVREDHLKDAHFDTRQYNHIVWSMSDLHAFRLKLRSRIEASIGRGPLRFITH